MRRETPLGDTAGSRYAMCPLFLSRPPHDGSSTDFFSSHVICLVQLLEASKHGLLRYAQQLGEFLPGCHWRIDVVECCENVTRGRFPWSAWIGVLTHTFDFRWIAISYRGVES